MIGGEGFTNLINGIITLVITLGVSFGVTMLLYKPEPLDPGMEKPQQNSLVDIKEDNKAQNTGPACPLVERIEIKSPVSGKLVSLKAVPDPVFSEGVLGQGAAVIPSEGKVYAPADGTVSAVVDTRHAIGFTTDTGVELLIHVGLDTVNMNGDGFINHCKMGDKVKTGDILLEFNRDAIAEAGLNPITPILVSNMSEFVSIRISESNELNNGDTIYTIV